MSEAESEEGGAYEWRPVVGRNPAGLDAAIRSLRAAGVLRDLNGTDLGADMESAPVDYDELDDRRLFAAGDNEPYTW